ncbi:hypothetical protein N7462_004439 [Penicillium macrosclerotiorum]|uniref:uncharacterized protein n=1 Tax=Penicillium macrosclerotiorum TaxID=303699 RepID=UPI0025493BD4|nr:uncharacterized protein N7462_004439 [Penicillium macrosclerotiorum]KAJ5690047.1 hypothetical protein N7462_004439 [Penicillium macrosclerotiorum]
MLINLGNVNAMASGLHVGSALAQAHDVNTRKAQTRSKESTWETSDIIVISEAETPAEIILRLNRLEGLLQQQTAAISALTDHLQSTPRETDTASHSNSSPVTQSNSRSKSIHYTSPNKNPLVGDLTYEYSDDDPLLIPLGHQTPTGNLLVLEQVKTLIGDYPQDFFLFLESERKIQPLVPKTSRSSIMERLALNRHTANFLIETFFTHVHTQFPILECQPFLKMFQTFLTDPAISDITSALCLTVLALGEICSGINEDFDIEVSSEGNGTEYFSHAYQILSTVETTFFSRDLNVPLAFFYASLYFRYRGRPLQAWRLIHTASSATQLMFSYLHDKSIPPDQHAVLVRIAWGCYVLEWLDPFHRDPFLLLDTG